LTLSTETKILLHVYAIKIKFYLISNAVTATIAMVSATIIWLARIAGPSVAHGRLPIYDETLQRTGMGERCYTEWPQSVCLLRRHHRQPGTQEADVAKKMKWTAVDRCNGGRSVAASEPDSEGGADWSRLQKSFVKGRIAAYSKVRFDQE
jgi:hypothetical protein